MMFMEKKGNWNKNVKKKENKIGKGKLEQIKMEIKIESKEIRKEKGK